MPLAGQPREHGYARATHFWQLRAQQPTEGIKPEGPGSQPASGQAVRQANPESCLGAVCKDPDP